ncbi:hypothetical protein YM392_0341 [Enterococcus faecalis]|nr:hypothetical protein YM392_0341 [Enterococcus faecalis]
MLNQIRYVTKNQPKSITPVIGKMTPTKTGVIIEMEKGE